VPEHVPSGPHHRPDPHPAAGADGPSRPDPSRPDPSRPGSSRPDPSQPDPSRPEAVLFDFHGTLVQVEDAIAWVVAAAAECGVRLDRARATGLADRLVTAGRAGGPLPSRVPPQLAEVWAERDLSSWAHRAAYTGLAATVPSGVDGLPEALYERLLRAEGWRVYADALGTLAALAEAGVPVAVVSNIGFDIRPICAELGLDRFVGAYVLSYEVGRCKPDPAIFLQACAALRVPPERALMVGDTPADAAAIAAGCPAYVLPAGAAGGVNGLSAVLRLIT
jgi:HAD superfamily hydrolase (TIGR01509 family)